MKTYGTKLYEDANANVRKNVDDINELLVKLVTKANELGLVVRVNVVPAAGAPLAMGNVDSVITVEPHLRLARYLDELKQLAEDAESEAARHAAECANGIHSWAMKAGKLDPDTACEHCGALYGHPD